jgi:hypothetical protein
MDDAGARITARVQWMSESGHVVATVLPVGDGLGQSIRRAGLSEEGVDAANFARLVSSTQGGKSG